MEIRQISEITSAHAQQLAKILLDAVNDGASVGFLKPFSLSDAASYWLKVNLALNDKHRLWIVLENDLILARNENKKKPVPKKSPVKNKVYTFDMLNDKFADNSLFKSKDSTITY